MSRSAAGPYRLATGGAIDRDASLDFRFDGRVLRGYDGDTLASGLLANGVRVVSRSFKFRRPRGVYTCGIEEPNALLRVGTGAHAISSVRATMLPLENGLEAFSQAGWPSVQTDAGRVLDFTAPLWIAGFYNKTFIWPGWHHYEGVIRRIGGLGAAPLESDPSRYETRNAHCDVLVIGAGIAGLSAALAAGEAGARVLLVEQHATLGGHHRAVDTPIDGVPAASWVAAMRRRLDALGTVSILPSTVAVGCYDHGVVTLLETGDDPQRVRECYWIVRTGRVIFATGAIEQPLVFANNDRPGVMLAGAARQFLRRFAIAPGRRVLIATNNDSAYALAAELHDAGVHVVAVTDTRSELASTIATDMRSRAITVKLRAIPVNTSGFGALRSVAIGTLARDGDAVQSIERHECDALAVSGGWNPALQLYSQAGGRLVFCERTRALKPVSAHDSAQLAGSAAGVETAAFAVLHAAGVGRRAAAAVMGTPADDTLPMPPPEQNLGIRVSPSGPKRRQWVDLRHDVTVADLELAVRENYLSIEHVKRYTTVGMSVDQGKTSHAAAIEVVAKSRGVSPAELGHTTLRPPFTPVTLGAIAGRDIGERFSPMRQLPTHEWHAAHGALFEDFGEWRRPVAYPAPGEARAAAMMREARAVRLSAGLMDGSSLGKIELIGPDALEFLDRFYINNLATLKPGRARYGFMLRESGSIFDDGTIVMLRPDHLLITTTSANSGRVAAWLEQWRQCEWPRLRVVIVPVTEQWATLSLAGPNARSILSAVAPRLDLSSAAFAHLSMRECELLGLPARIYRVSFSGELTYEINVPAGRALEVWSALLDAGAPFGLAPFGLDALTLLRLEKGFILVGVDTDSTTVPDDIGWGKVAAQKVRDYIGKRSLSLPEHIRAGRMQLIGLLARSDLVPGSHLKLANSTHQTDGWITSAGHSTQSDESIALAMVRAGREHVGETVNVHDRGRTMQARIVMPPFFDPAGERMNA